MSVLIGLTWFFKSWLRNLYIYRHTQHVFVILETDIRCLFACIFRGVGCGIVCYWCLFVGFCVCVFFGVFFGGYVCCCCVLFVCWFLCCCFCKLYLFVVCWFDLLVLGCFGVLFFRLLFVDVFFLFLFLFLFYFFVYEIKSSDFLTGIVIRTTARLKVVEPLDHVVHLHCRFLYTFTYITEICSKMVCVLLSWDPTTLQ